MKLLFVHQYFKTPSEGSGIRTWHLAQAFKNAGHEVSIITGHNHLKGKHMIDGLSVIYLKIAYSNHFGIIRRLFAFLNFVYSVKKMLSRQHDYDLLYILSTPLTTGLIGLHAKKNYGLKYLFEVGDLWPLAPIQMGAIKSKSLQNKLYHFEEQVYREAILLVGLSNAIKQGMEYTIDYQKPVEVLPNMSDCSYFELENNVPEQFTMESPLVIGYQGAVGKANHLEYLIALAELTQKEQLPVLFRIMGEGSRKASLQRLSKNLKLLTWVATGGKQEVREEMSKCHISYVSYAPFPVLETGSPNKLFDGLAAGKLILLNFKGWMAELVTENECGYFYDPSQPDEAIKLLKSLIHSPLLLEAYQHNARKLAEKDFEVSLITKKAVQIVESIVPA